MTALHPRWRLIWLCWIALTPVQTWAELKPVGQATAYWAGIIPVYDATLWTTPETTSANLLSDQTPLKLKLCYRVALTREEFVEAATQGLPSHLTPAQQTAVNKLHQRYQDVEKGDCYQLAYAPESGTALMLNDKTTFQDATPGFKAVYFGIWLGENALSDSVKSDLTASLPKGDSTP